MAVPTVMDRRLAQWCPGAPHRGLEHKTTLVNKDDGAAFTSRFFLCVASPHVATAQ
jgi:hypothetical protein